MNLIEGIQAQQKRVREDVIPVYEALGAPAGIAVALMRAAIAAGDKAIASGDVIQMLAAHADLEGFTL